MDENQKEEPLSAFLPVPVRARHDGWTPERQRAFIEHLADTGSVREAAALVGMTEQSAGRLRRRAGAAGFGAAWDAALRHGLKRILASVVDRAINGTIVRRYYHGELVAEERVHSERLMLYLLDKGDRMLARAETNRVMADWDGGLAQLAEAGEDGEGARHRVWQHDGDGGWLTNCPPPAGFNGWQDKAPGHPDYARTLTEEEEEIAAARADARAQTARAALFGVGVTRAADRPARSKRRR